MKTQYIAEIFELLSKGQFICSNSTDSHINKLYSYIDEDDNFEELYDYFIKINFSLDKGDEYYYFSRTESKVDLDRKLNRAYKWIDFIDFFKTFDNSFGSGFRFSPAEISVRLDVDVDLKTKLEKLKKYTSNQSNYTIAIKKIIELLEKDGFVELQNEITSTYKVLASFNYLEELILTINIPEEISNEIPK